MISLIMPVRSRGRCTNTHTRVVDLCVSSIQLFVVPLLFCVWENPCACCLLFTHTPGNMLYLYVYVSVVVVVLGFFRRDFKHIEINKFTETMVVVWLRLICKILIPLPACTNKHIFERQRQRQRQTAQTLGSRSQDWGFQKSRNSCLARNRELGKWGTRKS